MPLLVDRVGALAFRARESAHEINDVNATGIRSWRQAGIHSCEREMSRVYCLVTQQPHRQLGRKIIDC